MENEIPDLNRIKLLCETDRNMIGSLYAFRDDLIDELIDNPIDIQIIISKIKSNKDEIKILTNKVLTDYNTKHTLEYRLKQALESENYELAAKLRDKLKFIN